MLHMHGNYLFTSRTMFGMSRHHKKLQNVVQVPIRQRVKYSRARGSRVTATVKVSATQGLTATDRSELYSQEWNLQSEMTKVTASLSTAKIRERWWWKCYICTAIIYSLVYSWTMRTMFKSDCNSQSECYAGIDCYS